MANHASALKRARQSEKRRLRNKAVKTGLKTQIRKLNEAIEAGDKEAATKEFRTAQSMLAKAATKGTLHSKTAGRRIGRLAVRIQGL